MNKENIPNVVIYEDKHGKVEFQADIEKDTLWATQDQIAWLFNVQKAAISKHLKNIFKDGELTKEATVSKMETVQMEHKRVVKRQVDFYNLDAIIAVGYRVNSKKATQFRIWATSILRNYLIEGYALNKPRLEGTPEKLVGLYKTIAFLESKSLSGKLKGKITLKLTEELEPNK